MKWERGGWSVCFASVVRFDGCLSGAFGDTLCCARCWDYDGAGIFLGFYSSLLFFPWRWRGWAEGFGCRYLEICIWIMALFSSG